jgi:hypothetical protein
MRRDESLPGLGSRGDDGSPSGGGLSSSLRKGIVGEGERWRRLGRMLGKTKCGGDDHQP